MTAYRDADNHSNVDPDAPSGIAGSRSTLACERIPTPAGSSRPSHWRKFSTIVTCRMELPPPSPPAPRRSQAEARQRKCRADECVAEACDEYLYCTFHLAEVRRTNDLPPAPSVVPLPLTRRRVARPASAPATTVCSPHSVPLVQSLPAPEPPPAWCGEGSAAGSPCASSS